MKKILIATLLLLTTLLDAKQFTVTYVSTIDGANSSPQFNGGEPLILKVVLDNGNDNISSQTWTADDVVSVTFSFNSAPNTITSVFSSVETVKDGNFSTDAEGNLIAVPNEWTTEDYTVTDALVISTNDGNLTASSGAFAWYIRGVNGIYFTNEYENSASDLNVEDNINPAYWTLSETPVTQNIPVPFGGGCTYNPNNKGMDMIFVLLLLFAAAYPLRHKLIGTHK